MKRSFAALLALPLLLSAAGVGRAQEPPAVDPLIAESLKALGELVDATDCKVRDASDNDTADDNELPYVFCDDGLPPEGGGSLSIPVPAKYHAEEGDDWTALPLPASADEVASSNDDLQPESGNKISLDVDISLPPSAAAEALVGSDVTNVKPPKGGYPVVVFMHGCCGGNKTSWEANTVDDPGEKWHHSNAWFASRGYVVITYTARGFRNSNEQGSTGTTQLDSRRYEINDYQYLVGLLADHDAERRAAGEKPLFNINPKKVGAVGGSYGGGFTWLAITDPTWRSPAGRIKMKLAAAAPKYGWTDLLEALVPSGHYLDRDPTTGESWIAPTDVKQAASRSPLGVEKQSIVSGLYATGNLKSGNHTTFPEYLHSAFLRLQQGEPYDGDPTLEAVADSFLSDRSAYYQQRFWDRVAGRLEVPIFAAATWTDPLFPTMETVRFYNKLKDVDPEYPITMYLGDYQHFVANKAKEWGDLCGDDHHVCTLEDHRQPDSTLNMKRPAARVRVGINTRIDRYFDYYLRGRGRKPKSNVSATTTVCAANATDVLKVDEPGIEYRAADWRSLGADRMRFSWEGGGALFGMTSTGGVDMHAAESDPVYRDRQADKCYSTDRPPGAGVVRFEHQPLAEPVTMMGVPQWSMDYSPSTANYWVSARMFDLAPDGTSTLVTRGVCRANTDVNPQKTCGVFDLWGNAWRFEKDHRIVVELSQADTPMFRRNNFPSTIEVAKARLVMPVAPEALNVDFRNQ